MKPFDLQKALRGDPVVTRDGRPVTQLTHFEGVSGRESVFGVLDEKVNCWYEHGGYFNDGIEDNENDLLMAPKTKEGWINIYQTESGAWRTCGPIYGTEQEALDRNTSVIPTRIEWEAP